MWILPKRNSTEKLQGSGLYFLSLLIKCSEQLARLFPVYYLTRCTWDLPGYIIDVDLIKIYKVYDHVIIQNLGMFSEFHQQAIFINNVWINLVLRWWKKAKEESRKGASYYLN